MSRREDDPGGWGSKPEGTPASETRPIESEGSWFDSLSARPTQLAEQTEPGEPGPIDPELFERGALLSSPPSGARAGDAATVAGARFGVRSRRGAVRMRRNLTYIDPLSVLKVSVIVYAVLLGAWLLFVAIFYNFLEGLGLFENINSALRGFAYDEVDITLGVVERWALIAGTVLTIAGSVFNVFLALLYNLIARFLGGIEVTVDE